VIPAVVETLAHTASSARSQEDYHGIDEQYDARQHGSDGEELLG
jgi:hypothetical protein